MMLWMLCLLTLGAPDNLVPNPGFDAGAAGWSLPTQVRWVATGGRTSPGCLRLENRDAAAYPLATLNLPLQPGRRYGFSVWVKTADVAGSDTGATICLELYEGTRYLGGHYPAGVKGTHDWQQIRGSVGIRPDAQRTSIALYLRREMTGVAWFDDLEVAELLDPPLRTALHGPRYRGRLTAGQPATAEAVVADRLAGDPPLAELAVTVALRQGEREVWQRPLSLNQRRGRLAVPTTGLAAGPYQVRTSLRQGERELASSSADLTIVDPAAPRPSVYLDEHGRTIVNGEPVLPLGIYDGFASPADLKLIAAAGFNCLMPYGLLGPDLQRTRGYLDAAQAAGLRVIASVKDLYDGTTWRPKQVGPWTDVADITAGVVREFREHPALLAWYVNDELSLEYHAELVKRYRQVVDGDPNHPAWVVLYQVGELAGYVDTTDILGTDPYPVPTRPLSMAQDWTSQTVAAMAGQGSVWQVPQVFDWAVYKTTAAEKAQGRAPTRGEMRTMLYACLAAGAQGLICYSFGDLRRDPLGFDRRWPDVTAVIGEVKALTPLLLSVEPAPPTGLGQLPPGVAARAWRRGDEALMLLANGTTQPVELPWQLAAPKLLFGPATRCDPTGLNLPAGEAVAVQWRP
ncbi:MAG: hypothetical protein IT204_05765 [Fimbriimonadaceae bacterium]|nr:hypothetical protein [Fimbriimonadaceae bacterium]